MVSAESGEGVALLWKAIRDAAAALLPPEVATAGGPE
jgi:hypothetical protein